jgi:flagellar basal-body rod protein FlgB
MASTDLTVAVARAALDMAALQQQAIAHNIAHANAEGFAPVRVRFDDQLAALRRAADGKASMSEAMAVQPTFERSNAPVSLDAEMVDMSRNSLQYQTLTKLLHKEFELLQLGANEGRK